MTIEFIEAQLITMIDHSRETKRPTYNHLAGTEVILDPTDNRFIVGNGPRKELVSRSIATVARHLWLKQEKR